MDPPSAVAPMPPAKRLKADPMPAKKPALFQRTWHPGDEVRILKALAKHRRRHSCLPRPAELFAALNGRLEKEGVDRKVLDGKRRSLERRYSRDVNKAAPPADKHERRLYNLSTKVWGPWIHKPNSVTADAPPQPSTAQDEIAKDAVQEKSTGDEQADKDGAQANNKAGAGQDKSEDEPTGTQANSAGDKSGKDAPQEPRARTLAEMRKLCPCLVHEALPLVDPEVLERVLPSIDEDKVQELEKKINKIRKQITKVITESARMKNMEMPTVCLCPSTDKLRAEKENIVLFENSDETNDGMCTQERLAQVEREIVKMKQILMASQSQAKINYDNSMVKHVRCESAESGVRSVVAENQIPLNMLHKKIEAPKNIVVTSKNRYNPPGNNKLQNMILPTKGMFRGRKQKNDAESQAPCNGIQEMKVKALIQQDCCHERNAEGEKEVFLLSIKWPYTPVARAILQTCSQSEILGRTRPGAQFCKVFVTEVLQREAQLLHECGGDMTIMAHALRQSIEWPQGQIRGTSVADIASLYQQSRRGN